MKTLTQFLVESKPVLKESVHPKIKIVNSKDSRVSTEHRIPDDKFLGNCRWQGGRNDADLEIVSRAEASHLKLEKPLKSNEILARYITHTSSIGNLKPLIKIDLSGGKIYFFDAEYENETDMLKTLVGTRSIMYMNLFAETLAKTTRG